MATSGVEVTVWVTTAPDSVTTRVLTTGDGVSDGGTVDDDSDVDDEVVAGAGGGVLEEEEVDVLLGVCTVLACMVVQCLSASNLCNTQLGKTGHL